MTANSHSNLPPNYFSHEYVEMLVSDVRAAQRALLIDACQYNRRTLARALFSAVEGIIFGIKQTALRAADTGAAAFCAAELAALREEKYLLNRKAEASASPLFIRTEDNLIFALRMALRRYGRHFGIPKDDVGWSAFKASLIVRHRLTHPKSANDLIVSDSDLGLLVDAMAWFDTTTIVLVDLEIERMAQWIDAVNEGRCAPAI